MDEGESLAIGDTVKLNSGGPCMTVEALVSGRGAQCVWFSESERRAGVFHVDCLKLAAPDKDD